MNSGSRPGVRVARETGVPDRSKAPHRRGRDQTGNRKFQIICLMFKSFLVAGFAATAFLCSATSAFAAEGDPAPVAAPVTVEVAALASPTPRDRPDHQSVTAPAPAGVTGLATPVATPAPRRSLTELVAEHSGAAGTGEEFDCLASAVYYESRGEPLDGQLAVAEVILNRVRSGRFRSTICDVVKQPSQFSFVRRGVIPSAPRESAAWQRAAAIAHIAMNDLADATGDNSLFFHATHVNPRWGRPRVARIGNHIFYR